MLEVNPNLTAFEIEGILEGTALPMPASASRHVYDFDHFADIVWDTDCDGSLCDPVGAGLMLADAAIGAID